MIRTALLLLMLAAPAWAEVVVGPDAFERLTEGRTLTYSQGGTYYGTEQYLSDRRVIWRYADGTCAFGRWFARDTDICFLYDAAASAQCWVFAQRGGAYFARVTGLAAGDVSELMLTGEIDGNIDCAAPNLGV